MPKFAFLILLLAIVWVAWCVLVLTVLVPTIRIHVTFWDGAMAWLLSVLPVAIGAAIFLVRTKPETR
ncbi:MAG TPA: hypothetical protein VHZ55_15335 [Bryobacteraceae bacterium]|jgi:hypothetical protein|nr:hypothetical protein [Bryobacteraceae bacterium]